MPAGRRRALSRRDGGLDGVGRSHTRRAGRRRPPAAAVAAGDRASTSAAGSAVAQRDFVGTGGDGPAAAGQARPAFQSHCPGRLTMTWNLDTALVTTFTLVRDNFAAFFAVALLFNAPSLVVGFIDGGFAVALVVGVVAHVLL